MNVIQDLQKQLKAKQEEWKRIKEDIARREDVMAQIDVVIKHGNITEKTYPGSFKDKLQFRDWFANVRTLPIEDWEEENMRRGWSDAYETPEVNATEPGNLMQEIKNELNRRKDRFGRQLPYLNATKATLTGQIDNLQTSIQTLKQGKKGTGRSLWVPAGIFLLGAIAFEAFKPEILNWIRHLFGLASLPR